MRYEVAAVIVGFSRKILALKVYSERPGTNDLMSLIDRSVRVNGDPPKFFITDHGCQFQKQFKTLLKRKSITHARGKPQTCQFNAKVKRLFWGLKKWSPYVLVTPDTRRIQRHLNHYKTWHNRYRPHAALDTLTPNEAAKNAAQKPTTRFTEGEEYDLEITLERKHVGSDRRLLYPVIGIAPKKRSAA